MNCAGLTTHHSHGPWYSRGAVRHCSVFPTRMVPPCSDSGCWSPLLLEHSHPHTPTSSAPFPLIRLMILVRNPRSYCQLLDPGVADATPMSPTDDCDDGATAVPDQPLQSEWCRIRLFAILFSAMASSLAWAVQVRFVFFIYRGC
jgi:hypothetical protein